MERETGLHAHNSLICLKCIWTKLYGHKLINPITSVYMHWDFIQDKSAVLTYAEL